MATEKCFEMKVWAFPILKKYNLKFFFYDSRDVGDFPSEIATKYIQNTILLYRLYQGFVYTISEAFKSSSVLDTRVIFYLI